MRRPRRVSRVVSVSGVPQALLVPIEQEHPQSHTAGPPSPTSPHNPARRSQRLALEEGGRRRRGCPPLRRSRAAQRPRALTRGHRAPHTAEGWPGTAGAPHRVERHRATRPTHRRRTPDPLQCDGSPAPTSTRADEAPSRPIGAVPPRSTCPVCTLHTTRKHARQPHPHAPDLAPHSALGPARMRRPARNTLSLSERLSTSS